MPQSICVFATHRSKTIEGADSILTLDAGSLAEKGVHAELMERNGLYRNIYERRKLEDELHSSIYQS
jgi:ATP-binding cassette subfamily B protein